MEDEDSALGAAFELDAALETAEMDGFGLGSDLAGGEPGAGDGEAAVEPAAKCGSVSLSSIHDPAPFLPLGPSLFDWIAATSAFHLRTISFARSATSLLGFCRSLLTVTPIFVSCRRGKRQRVRDISVV